MDFNLFKQMYAETMMFYQCIENDIKCIYAYMCAGNINKHFDEIENKTLGQTIRILKKLDNSDGKPLINLEDYEFLEKICDNRNHWAHSVFTEFIYEDNWLYSKEYLEQCKRLKEDYVRIKNASKILERIRIQYCTNIRKGDY